MADIKKIATRQSYGDALAQLGEEFPIIVLDADLSKSTKQRFLRKNTPTDS